jgi:hypothetical protein
MVKGYSISSKVGNTVRNIKLISANDGADIPAKSDGYGSIYLYSSIVKRILYVVWADELTLRPKSERNAYCGVTGARYMLTKPGEPAPPVLVGNPPEKSKPKSMNLFGQPVPGVIWRVFVVPDRLSSRTVILAGFPYGSVRYSATKAT